MQAVVCERWGSPGDMVLRDVASPALVAGSVRIGVRYVAASFGTTVMVAGRYQRSFDLPFVPGTEVSGVVLQVADDVHSLTVGDRVCAAIDHGGLAQEAIASTDTTYRVPDGIDLATAVTLPLTYGTPWAALRWRAHIERGETLLVHGAAGGVGLAAIDIGRHLGCRVIAVAGSEDKLAAARLQGAHHGVLADAADIARQVRQWTDGRGADVVFDPVGGRLFDAALSAVAQEGRLLVVGFTSGEVPQVAANLLLVKNASVMGFNFGQYVGWGRIDERRHHAPRVQGLMAELFGGVQRGELRPQTSLRFALADFAAAYDAVMARRSIGRVLLQVSPDDAG